ncbi:MAG: hypothetical protein WCW54_00195 [Candidatus Paceibacterota bacterium]
MFYNTKNLYIRNHLLMILVFFIFIILTIWWLILNPFLNSESTSIIHDKYIWGSFYQILALLGGIIGVIISKNFGGFKSQLGRSILYFSIGLFLQSFGQSVYSYFNLFAQIQAPYPSIGDIGYFGSVILYILGVMSLAKISGAKISLKLFRGKIQAILLPLIMLIGSYSMFLKNYEFDWANKLKIFLDFGYPLGQAFYVSLAILTLILTRNILGGIMKKPIILFLISLIAQYIADSYFLFQANNGSWYVGGIGDFLYVISYFLMTISIIQTGYVLRSLKETN